MASYSTYPNAAGTQYNSQYVDYTADQQYSNTTLPYQYESNQYEQPSYKNSQDCAYQPVLAASNRAGNPKMMSVYEVGTTKYSNSSTAYQAKNAAPYLRNEHNYTESKHPNPTSPYNSSQTAYAISYYVDTSVTISEYSKQSIQYSLPKTDYTNSYSYTNQSKAPPQTMYNRGKRFSTGYNSNQTNNQTEASNSNGDRKYATMDQFRKFYSNRQKERKQPAPEQGQVTPSLFMGKDPTYPNELNNLMHPFFCALCKCRLNSIKSSNIHYESKAHDRHITLWIKKTYVDKDLPAPTLQRFVTEVTSELPGIYRCELCKLELSSAQHALQHYNGRRHRNAAGKISLPTGIGYFDVEGKWVETGKLIDQKTGKEVAYTMVKTPTGFEPVVLHSAANLASPPAAKETPTLEEKQVQADKEPPAKKRHLEVKESLPAANPDNKITQQINNTPITQLKEIKASPNPSMPNDITVAPSTKAAIQFKPLSIQSPESTQCIQTPEKALETKHCVVCGICTTSKDQMLLHLKGVRHSKKLKALGEPRLSLMFLTAPATILESLNTNDQSDISMYRTPSGSYYCKTCNAALPDMSRMRKHILSKKHLAAVRNQEGTKAPYVSAIRPH